MITDPAYDPSGSAPNTGTPPSDPTKLPAAIKIDLQKAFDNAPAFFKNQLCKLDGLLIIPTGSPIRSWGFRNTSKQRYVAISQDTLWPSNSLVTFLDYKNTQLLQLFPKLINDTKAPKYDAATPPDGWMALLAALAHEYGHIYWNDVLIDPPGHLTPNYGKFCPGVYPAISWNGLPQSVKWRKFPAAMDGEADEPKDMADDPSDPPNAGEGDGPSKDVRISNIKAKHSRGTMREFKNARRLIKRLLSLRRPWASVFAAFSANEDFVETFTLYVLMNAETPLTELKFSIVINAIGNKVSHDVPGAVIKGERPLLSSKLLCFDDYLVRNLSSLSWP